MSFADFYRHALLYLACVKVEEDIPLEEARERAHDLCIAALLGETIYNFGELIGHPILKVLSGTPFEYLSKVLLCFNSGDHMAFDQLLPSILQHPTLGQREDTLRQKLCLMGLVEAVFRQLKISRSIPFGDIALATRVPIQQVELVVMKALSLGLIRGTLQEPEAKFIIEWVQPRVLDLNQISDLRAGIQAWRVRVQETAQLIQSSIPEQLTTLST